MILLPGRRDRQNLEIFCSVVERSWVFVVFLICDAKMRERCPSASRFLFAVLSDIYVGGMPSFVGPESWLEGLTFLLVGIVPVARHGDILRKCPLLQELAEIDTFVHRRLRLDQRLHPLTLATRLVRILQCSRHAPLEGAESYL